MPPHKEVRQLKEQNRRLELVNHVARHVAATLDLDQILSEVVQQIRQAMNCYGVSVALVEGDQVVFRAAETAERLWHAEAVRANTQQIGGPGLNAWVAAAGEPLFVSDVSHEPRFIPFSGVPLTRSALLLPLKLDGQVVGVVNVQSDRLNAFDQADLALLELLAPHITAAIRNARLFASLAEERQRLTTILEHVADAVLFIDRQGRIINVNDSRGLLSGLHAGPLAGVSIHQLLIVDGMSGLTFDDLLREAVSERRVIPPREQLAVVRDRNGAVRHGQQNQRTVAVALAPVIDDLRAEVNRVVVALWDVSPQAELERLRSEIVTIVSHELRMPLTKIYLAVERAAQSGQDLDREWLRVVSIETKQLIRLVESMLEASHVEARQIDVHAEPVAIVSLVRQVIRSYQDPQRIHLTIAPDLPLVYGDRDKIQAVLNNLINNALSYSRPEDLVEIEVGRLEEQWIRTSVRDHGEGIPADQLTRVFDRFHRLDQRDSRRTYGFGLGLYIAKGLVEAQGGRIWVESQLGSGSTFHFVLPVYFVLHGGGETLKVFARTNENSFSREGAMARILIVDDDKSFVLLLQSHLMEAGYEVKAVYNGQEALQAAFQFRPHLVLLDIMLPNLDGWETCRRLRDFYDGVIIMLTVRNGEIDKVRGFDLGADDYLTKPFSEQELLARIRAHLRLAHIQAREGRPTYMDENLLIDLAHRQVLKHGQLVPLTPTEFDLLACLVRHSGETLSHKKLLGEALGPEYTDELEYLKVYIGRLREKLEDDPKHPTYIHTHRGLGYSFNTSRLAG